METEKQTDKHKHEKCLHRELKHCDACDVVECLGCKKEWGGTTWKTFKTDSSDGSTWYPISKF